MAKVTGRPAFVEENLSGRTYVEGCDDGGAIKGRSGGQKGKCAISLKKGERRAGFREADGVVDPLKIVSMPCGKNAGPLRRSANLKHLRGG